MNPAIIVFYSIFFCFLTFINLQAQGGKRVYDIKADESPKKSNIQESFIFSKFDKGKSEQLKKTTAVNSNDIVLSKYSGVVDGLLALKIPNGPQDYFAVRYEIPAGITAPYSVSQVRFYNSDSQTIWPFILVTQANENNHPDLNNPIAEFNNVSGPNLDFLTISTNITINNLDDIFFVIQMPPGESFGIPGGEDNGPAIGAELTSNAGQIPGNLYSTDGNIFYDLTNFNLAVELTVKEAIVTGLVFHVERSTGNVSSQGSFIPSGADLAEYIKVSEAVEPGDIVELHPSKSQHYRKARGKNQRIAGIITTNPGLILGNNVEKIKPLFDKSTGKAFQSETVIHPSLALLGRVPVKATTENGPIRSGDLLTVSSKPGYAMRCEEASACEGTLVGKALEGLEKSDGLILTLVMAH